jgi:tetratricopeptide (TPR) repeat protein
VTLDLPEQALIHARRVLELSEELGDRQLQAIALNNLGWMHSNDGDQAAAIDCAQRALVLLSDLGDDLPAFESFAAEDASTRR